MMQTKRILAIVLLILLAFMPEFSALSEDDGNPYGLSLLLDESEIPQATTLSWDVSVPDGAITEERSTNVELVSTKGDVLNVEVRFVLVNLPLSDSQWAEVASWVKGVVTNAVQQVGADSESLANVVANAITEQRQANATSMSIWANSNLKVKSVCARVPYFPELQVGSYGGATQRLQQKLITMGFLTGSADGSFGENTKKGVKALEEYVRVLEQDVIKTLPEPTPSPVPDDYMVPVHIELPAFEDVSEEPEATPTPVPVPTPATPVDGVADPLLQAYLFSDDFKLYRREVKSGSSGVDVTRVQRRLYGLGYLSDEPDGKMGDGTTRALSIFQSYNGLPVTGYADAATMKALFDENARKPGNAMLKYGATGDAVKKLQMRLRVLGFGSINVDGNYGESTKAGVQNLQTYMQGLEANAAAAAANGQGVSADIPTVVNGIADSLLLDEFYSEKFPAVPAAMGNGVKGADVVRLQRRLSLLEFYTGAIDGDYGTGTVSAVSLFQKQHHLPQSGYCDKNTLAKIFGEDAQKALKPYLLKVSVDDQRVYIYEPDDNNEYTVLVKEMKCSTGTKGNDTPLGTFTSTTGPGARWHYFEKFTCWAQYAYYIKGDIMFHSVLFNQQGGNPTSSSVRNLGKRASHGCVRLSVEDAEWIWRNCPKNTTVIVY